MTESHHSGGLKGRRSVLEILELTPDVQLALLLGETPSLMRRRQMAEGTFNDLWDDALRLIVEGVVGFTELEAELKDYLRDRTGFRASTPQPNDNKVVRAFHSATTEATVKNHDQHSNQPQPKALDNLSSL
jgi:hypothetical protein